MAAAIGGRRGCKLDCRHRRFVLDYVAERDSQLIRAEAATGGNATELGDYFGAGGRPVEARLTFREYLTTRAGLDYPYPAPRSIVGRRRVPIRPACELAA